ncbi:hypothetical protein BKA93DRAFT_877459 [Sparassis latifolia]|uniref:Uncharacterized protein n=1 Tax=Sparassis crispa TaxID=139825 RepID=A0A401GLK9_9APHY|nr:hypothetical protein SCP_0501270 [Sparassis crispa]GBE83081.1 hypothetical protein SCP_0501270 [Sparassis crispa]
MLLALLSTPVHHHAFSIPRQGPRWLVAQSAFLRHAEVNVEEPRVGPLTSNGHADDMIWVAVDIQGLTSELSD